MHVRETKVRRGAKTYRYVQLVRSYRRADGTPVHEVIASFPYESELQAANLRNFALAQRQGVELVLHADAPAPAMPARPVVANRRYLDLAVLRRVWRDAGLQDLVRAVVARASEEVADADVVEALVLHRCASPGSKLSAVRWFTETALPEITGIRASQFNNSCLHRALDALHAAEGELQDQLPRHLQSTHGAFVAMFMDGTDTWFEGPGPNLAALGRVKDGSYRRKVLIIVLCDQRGFPLRWRTLSGSTAEVHGMSDLWQQVAGCDWVGDAPIVADRAMGSAAVVEQLAAAGPRFLVAVREPEFRSWVPDLTGLPVEMPADECIEAVEKQGFARIDDRTWFWDAGVAPDVVAPDDAAPSPSATLADAIDLARQMGAAGGSTRSLQKKFGCSTGHIQRHRALLRLPIDVVARVCAGEAELLTLRGLVDVATAGPPDAQRQAFEDALQRATRKPRSRKPVAPPPVGARTAARVRRVVYFNPEMFAEQRKNADAQLARLDAWVTALNARVRTSPKRYSATKLRSQVGRELARQAVLDLFEVEIDELQGVPQVRLARDDREWARRRSLDGHSLLLAHAGIDRDGPGLIALYRQRNTVEVDFRTIKSVLELRPVYHHTDAKVSAHVTLCVLALLLARVLEHRLADAGVEMTMPAALEVLATCHLNEVLRDRSGRITYTTTHTTTKQDRILSALGLCQLVDDEVIGNTITPR